MTSRTVVAGGNVDGASLDVAKVRHEGKRAGRLDPKRRSARISATTNRLSGRRPRRTGERMGQVEGGSSVGEGATARDRARQDDREAHDVVQDARAATGRSIPSMRFPTTGFEDARIKVRIRTGGKRPRPIFVDTFKVLRRPRPTP